jgi:hypothetical protein
MSKIVQENYVSCRNCMCIYNLQHIQNDITMTKNAVNVWVYIHKIFISFLKEFHSSQKIYSQIKSKDPTSCGTNAAHTSGHHGVITGNI